MRYLICLAVSLVASPAWAQYYDESSRPIILDEKELELRVLENMNRRLVRLEDKVFGPYSAPSYAPTYNQPKTIAPPATNGPPSMEPAVFRRVSYSPSPSPFPEPPPFLDPPTHVQRVDRILFPDAPVVRRVVVRVVFVPCED